MRYMVKGGIWKNTEDEILKAAVMKYGLNQWSRISSLLVRKSAKECKARWYEWLDPSIKKTEWTREEEEKLLHLAKIFPTQWRTIAPIIGRTPSQCIEHYEKLLDQAQGKGGDLEENDPRRLRPGEIDPNPETKPCRPDPIDMDDDEKEMLQECRARLANTKGKKAKRKAREKQLEEARRMAQLQKQRELKAAGIDIFKPTKIRGVNYNIEIPFERKVPEGRFAIGNDEDPKLNQFKSNIALQQIEMKRRDEEEKKKRALDDKRMKKLKQKNLPKAMEIISKTNDALLHPKTQLLLPAPQISDNELNAIKKYATGTLDNVISATENNAATRALVGNYSQRDILQTPLQMKTPLMSQKIMQDAQNALIFKNTQTPLIGGVNPELIDTSTYKQDYQNATPNILLQKRPPSTQVEQSQKDGVMLPPSKRVKQSGGQMLPPSGLPQRLQTPLRDEMKLNQEENLADSAWEKSSLASGMTGQQIDTSSAHGYQHILETLHSLPQPKNVYEMSEEVIIQKEEEIARLEEEMLRRQEDRQRVEDLEDQELRLNEEKSLLEEIERKKRSQVIKQNLPRPLQINQKFFKSLQDDPKQQEVDKMIFEEMYQMLINDNYKYPIKGMREIKKPPLHFQDINPIYLEYANTLIIEEAQKKTSLSHYPMHTFSEADNDLQPKAMFFPGTKDYDYIANHTPAEQLEALKFEFNNAKNHMEREITRCVKLEEKGLKILFGGYYKREEQLRSQFEKTMQEWQKGAIEAEVFKLLEGQEQKSLRIRAAEMAKALQMQEEKENELQRHYSNLKSEKERLEKTIMSIKGNQMQ